MEPKFTTLQLNSVIEQYANHNDLNTKEKELIKQAAQVMGSAYAPYSDFKVGAAVLLENGTIITGNNQENAAYPSGLCAERVALFYAGSQHPKVPVIAVAIMCQTAEPAAPCGSCRQVIAEYEHLAGSPIRIIMAGQNGKVLAASGIASLLPLLFNRNSLK